MVDKPSNIVYSVSSWLPLTMNWIYAQIKYQDDFTPLIFTNSIENIDQLPDYPVITIKSPQKRAFYASMRKAGVRLIPTDFQTALEQYNPTILHSHFGDWGWYDLPMASKNNLKQIVSFYGYDLSLLPMSRPKWKKRYQELFKSAVRFLCEGPHMAQSLVDLGCPRDKVSVFHLGVDLSQLPFKPRQFGSNDQLKILIAGHFVEKKGIPYAIEACALLKEIFPNFHVTIFGDSTGSARDEKEKQNIVNTIHHFGLDPYITMRGFQPLNILVSEMYEHHIFLSPSITASDGDTEGGAPVTIIQALASGMPVVSTNHCDIPGVITSNVSGLLASERNSKELADHLYWLITHPDNWERMVTIGRRNIELEFNVRLQGERLINIYNELGF